MRALILTLLTSILSLPGCASSPAGAPPGVVPDSPAARNTGTARADPARPRSFPHRIWAACDFEARTPDYGWFGSPETRNIPRYPGNATALGAAPGSGGDASTVLTGINPVPGPCMGKVNSLHLRYYLKGASEAVFQHFSLTAEDNNHVRVTGLEEGKWSELTVHFTRDARRNDGTPGVPFREGERMDDFKVYAGKPGDGKAYELAIDDVIFFAEDPDLPPDPEPFPRRVIFLAAFDTGTTAAEKPKYWPGEHEVVTGGLPPGSYRGVARAVPRKDGKSRWIQLKVDPPRPVGERTKLRFRYHLTGASAMTVQVFDATDQDNRHIRLDGLERNAWTSVHLDFTRDGKRNDGSRTPFAAGHVVDDIFFFVEADGKEEAAAEPVLLVDEVVLYDAATEQPGKDPN